MIKENKFDPYKEFVECNSDVSKMIKDFVFLCL